MQLKNILTLINDYEALSKSSDEDNKLGIEKLKLNCMRLVENHLKQDLQSLSGMTIKEDEQTYTFFYTELLYYILAVLGITTDAAIKYLFGSTLIALIPNITRSEQIILSIFYIILEAILFYAFQVALLRNALGIADIKTQFHEYNCTNIDQCQIVTRINRLLINLKESGIDNKAYEEYKTMVVILNNDLLTKYHAMQDYEESFFKKLLKIVLLAFGMITDIASTYYTINAVLTLCAPTLIGTPLGLVLIILAITTGLGFYYAMGASGIMRMMSLDYESHKTLNKELSSFKQEHMLFFSNHIRASRTILNSKIECDIERSTETHCFI